MFPVIELIDMFNIMLRKDQMLFIIIRKVLIKFRTIRYRISRMHCFLAHRILSSSSVFLSILCFGIIALHLDCNLSFVFDAFSSCNFLNCPENLYFSTQTCLCPTKSGRSLALRYFSQVFCSQY